MSVAVVTDSTSDLSPAWLSAHGVRTVPLMVEMGGESYRDRLDLSAEDFLRQLPAMRELPHTAAPSPGAFRTVYEEAFAAGAEAICSIHLAGGLSSTVRSAEVAARMVDGPVAVIDGESASLGTALLVWWATRRAAQGASLEQLGQELTALKGRLFAFAAPVTLEYLARGGRIGQAARLVGTILDMKPILLLEHGHFRPARKVRGERQIAPGMVASAAERLAEGTPVLAALGHSGSPERHQGLVDSINRRYRVRGWLDGVIGPVISTHVGPGAFGIILLPLSEAEDALWTTMTEEEEHE
ncbi:DegV family protein [Sulfobacillus harzensis]|uniref:DegV family protein n=1 Tax=Sulfobacillus harzensis TaxID=2729629 RepID=A0A7Y0L5Q8_9FIRM|nr:DegV family protein [Sulfobacillus harzensis]NMP22980.1 DegV family protein [Sulfobacillus harzensis]